jgi:hypothetical protein
MTVYIPSIWGRFMQQVNLRLWDPQVTLWLSFLFHITMWDIVASEHVIHQMKRHVCNHKLVFKIRTEFCYISIKCVSHSTTSCLVLFVWVLEFFHVCGSFHPQTYWADCCGLVPQSTQFKYRQEHQLSWLRFHLAFRSQSRQIPKWYLN